MTTVILGKRNRRTNLQLAQDAIRQSEYDEKRLTDHLEDDSAPEDLVARFSFAEDLLEDESSVIVDITSEDGEFSADLTTDGEFWADKSSEFVNGDSWADM